MGSLEALSLAGEDKELTWHDALWEATVEGLLCCWYRVLCISPAFWRAGVVPRYSPATKKTTVLQTCSLPKAAKHSSDGASIWKYSVISLQNRLCLSVQLVLVYFATFHKALVTWVLLNYILNFEKSCVSESLKEWNVAIVCFFLKYSSLFFLACERAVEGVMNRSWAMAHNEQCTIC